MNVWWHYCRVKKAKWFTWLDACPCCGEKRPYLPQIKEEFLK